MTTTLAIGAVAVLIGGVIQGCTGFGFALVVVPTLLLAMPSSVVVPTVVGINIFSSAILLAESRKKISTEILVPLLCGGLAGVAIGSYFLRSVDDRFLKLAVGILVSGFAFALLVGWSRPLRNQKAALLPVGILSGLLQGAIAIPGPPVILFLSNQNVPKATFRATFVSYFFGLNVVTITIFALSGFFDATVGKNVAVFLPAMVLGLFFGIRLSRVISEESFRRLTLALAIVMGCILLVTSGRALFGGG